MSENIVKMRMRQAEVVQLGNVSRGFGRHADR